MPDLCRGEIKGLEKKDFPSSVWTLDKYKASGITRKIFVQFLDNFSDNCICCSDLAGLFDWWVQLRWKLPGYGGGRCGGQTEITALNTTATVPRYHLQHLQRLTLHPLPSSSSSKRSCRFKKYHLTWLLYLNCIQTREASEYIVVVVCVWFIFYVVRLLCFSGVTLLIYLALSPGTKGLVPPLQGCVGSRVGYQFMVDNKSYLPSSSSEIPKYQNLPENHHHDYHHHYKESFY